MKFKNIFFRVISIIVIITFLFVSFVFISGSKGYVVLSNSMLPTFRRGDVVFVKKIDFNELDVNDIVTINFKNSNGTFTHRIVKIDKENNMVYTKGDNSLIVDNLPSESERIRGKVWFSIPIVGYISILIINKITLVMLLGILILLIIISSVISSYKKKKVRGDYVEKN